MAVRFRPFTGTSRGFPSADDVGGRRQESDVTELDRTGDPDSAGRHAAPGGDGGAEGPHAGHLGGVDVQDPVRVVGGELDTGRVAAGVIAGVVTAVGCRYSLRRLGHRGCVAGLGVSAGRLGERDGGFPARSASTGSAWSSSAGSVAAAGWSVADSSGASSLCPAPRASSTAPGKRASSLSSAGRALMMVTVDLLGWPRRDLRRRWASRAATQLPRRWPRRAAGVPAGRSRCDRTPNRRPRSVAARDLTGTGRPGSSAGPPPACNVPTPGLRRGPGGRQCAGGVMSAC